MAIKINGDNSVANPGFTGADTDTGLQVGTNELKLVTGGTAKATVDTNGTAKFTGANAPSGLDTRITQYGSLLVGTNSDTVSDARCSIDAGNGNITSIGIIDAGSAALTTNGARLRDSGAIQIRRDGTGENVFEVYKGGSASGSIKATINSDGAATFAGGATTVDSSGTITVIRSSDTNDVYQAYTGSTRNISFKAGGSATFGQASNSTNNNGVSIGGNNGSLNVYTTRYSTDCFQILNTSGSGTNVAVRFDGDGSASFAGNVTVDGSITLSADNPDWTINPSGNSTLYGRVDIGTDASAVAGTCSYMVSNDNNSYAATVNFRNIGTGPSIISRTQAGADAFRVESNGDVKSATNSYGSTSDIKFKENIVDASSQWDDVKAIRVRKFNFKEETLYDTSTQIGVIAQEIETVSPGLVTSTVDSDEEGNDLGTVTKSVKYSVLYMKSVKALQEAMTRIETLETQNADLTARITALETA